MNHAPDWLLFKVCVQVYLLSFFLVWGCRWWCCSRWEHTLIDVYTHVSLAEQYWRSLRNTVCIHEKCSVTARMYLQSWTAHWQTVEKMWVHLQQALCIRVEHPKQKCYVLKTCLSRMHLHITSMIPCNLTILSHLLHTKPCLSCSF